MFQMMIIMVIHAVSRYKQRIIINIAHDLTYGRLGLILAILLASHVPNSAHKNDK